MRFHPKKLALRLLWILILFSLFCLVSPPMQAQLFVTFRGSGIEDAIAAGEALPAEGHRWESGDHTMYEFPLSGSGLGSGTAYYGCYYSPDDVPLSFQNAGEALIPQDSGQWKWFGKGDNWGSTRRLRRGWYYYEAHF